MVIGSNSTILDDSIVPAGAVIPENCIYGGKPAVFKETAYDSHEQEHMTYMVMYYENIKSLYLDFISYKKKAKRAAK